MTPIATTKSLRPDDLMLLSLLAGGRTTGAAAKEMLLTTDQVYEMLRRIRRTLGVDTTVEAVVLVVRRKLI